MEPQPHTLDEGSLRELRLAIAHRSLARQAALDAMERLEEATDAFADTSAEIRHYRECVAALDEAHRRLVALAAKMRAHAV